MMELIPDYMKHLEEHPDSLISKVYGMFTITTCINGDETKYRVYM